MGDNGYSFQGYDAKRMARARGVLLPISQKASREVAQSVKGRNLDKAIDFLEKVVVGIVPVPFKRFKRDVPHRKGKMAAGRYPKNASLEMISLLKLLKSNAIDHGLNGDNLVVIHAAASPGPRRPRTGRIRGERKISHLEVVAEEIKKEKKKAPEQNPAEKKAEKKVEEKAEPKKEKKKKPKKVEKEKKPKETQKK